MTSTHNRLVEATKLVTSLFTPPESDPNSLETPKKATKSSVLKIALPTYDDKDIVDIFLEWTGEESSEFNGDFLKDVYTFTKLIIMEVPPNSESLATIISENEDIGELVSFLKDFDIINDQILNLLHVLHSIQEISKDANNTAGIRSRVTYILTLYCIACVQYMGVGIESESDLDKLNKIFVQFWENARGVVGKNEAPGAPKMDSEPDESP